MPNTTDVKLIDERNALAAKLAFKGRALAFVPTCHNALTSRDPSCSILAARSRWHSISGLQKLAGEAMPYPEADHLAAIKASFSKFEERISALTDDPLSRRQCRVAANELMVVLQALVNRCGNRTA